MKLSHTLRLALGLHSFHDKSLCWLISINLPGFGIALDRWTEIYLWVHWHEYFQKGLTK